MSSKDFKESKMNQICCTQVLFCCSVHPCLPFHIVHSYKLLPLFNGFPPRQQCKHSQEDSPCPLAMPVPAAVGQELLGCRDSVSLLVVSVVWRGSSHFTKQMTYLFAPAPAPAAVPAPSAAPAGSTPPVQLTTQPVSNLLGTSTQLPA